MRKLLLALLLLGFAGQVEAAPGGCGSGTSGSLTTIGFEQITVSSTGLGFTVAVFTANGATPQLAVVAVETNAIRSRSDGLNPTAAVGLPWAAATAFTVCGEQAIRAIRFIRQSADATLSVEYYKEGN